MTMQDNEDPRSRRFYVIVFVLTMLVSGILTAIQWKSDAMPVCGNAVRTTVSQSSEACIPLKRRTFKRHLKAGDYGNARGIELPSSAKAEIRQLYRRSGKTISARSGPAWYEKILSAKQCLVGGGLAHAVMSGRISAGQGCSQTTASMQTTRATVQRSVLHASWTCSGVPVIATIIGNWQKVDDHWVYLGKTKVLVAKNFFIFAACTTITTFANIRKFTEAS